MDDGDLVALLQSLVDPPDCPAPFQQHEGTLMEAETVGSNLVIGVGTPPERSVLTERPLDGTRGEVWEGFISSTIGESSNPRDSSPIDGGDRLPSRFSNSQLGAIGGLDVRKKENQEAGEDLVAGFLLLDGMPISSSCSDLEVIDRFMDSPEEETRCVLPVNDEGDADDLIKKRKRQIRNRDSAVRSRERKKMYVKDLEMKNQFLEFECRRLQQAFALCCAENHALRIGALGLEAASTARQESAVLRTESLLLGSLLWLVGLLWRVLLPFPARLPVEGGVGVEEKERRASAPTAPTKRMISERLFGSRLILLRRRCRAARKKMKGFKDFAVP